MYEAITAKKINFEDLSFEEQKQHFEDCAKRALAFWDYPEDSQLKLLNITENATYLVTHEGYEKMIMRVHRLAYAEYDSIRTEIAWILELREKSNLHLATPYKSNNGDYVRTIETPEMGESRHVVCFSFEEGKAPVDSKDDTESIGKIAAIMAKIPNKVSVPIFRTAAVAYAKMNEVLPSSAGDSLTESDKATYQTLGEIAAELHVRAKAWDKPDYFKRIEWDWDATFGDGWNNYYGMHYRDCDCLSEADCEAIDSCAYLMHKRLLAYGKGADRYGMVHSDLRMSNLLDDGSKITVLDFDDSGYGWYMFDIAGIVGFMEHRPDLKEILDNVITGYNKVSPLSDADITEIPTFIMMRRIGLLECMMYHIANTEPGSGESAELSPEIMAFYAKGTVLLAREYIKNYKDRPLPASEAVAEIGA